MPVAGVPNNPSGLNNFDQFSPEPAYGEATKDAQLQRGAPLAGGAVASGPIQAAKRAGRQAAKGQPVSVAPVAAQAAPVGAAPSYDARLAQYWQSVAAIPGASDLVKEYAALAAQRVAGV